jgi:hypothetical protein
MDTFQRKCSERRRERQDKEKIMKRRDNGQTTTIQRPDKTREQQDDDKTRHDKDKSMARKDNTCLTSFSGNGLKEDTDLSTMAKRGRMFFTVSTMRFTCSPPLGELIRVRVRVRVRVRLMMKDVYHVREYTRMTVRDKKELVHAPL